MKDSCYHSVKARYDVFPSARASQAIAKCRKGKGSVRKTSKGSSLKRWQKEKWTDTKTGKACGAGGSNEYCRPKKKVSSKTPKTIGEMSKSELRRKKAEKSRVGMGSRVTSLSTPESLKGHVIGALATGGVLGGMAAKKKFIDAPKRKKETQKYDNEMRKVWTREKVRAKEAKLSKFLKSKGEAFADGPAWNMNTDYGYKIYSPKKRAYPSATLNRDGTMSVYDRKLNVAAKFSSLDEILEL